MKTTKRSLLTNLTALLLCFVMLIGTTFAWFTDEVTSANNVIQAGDLDAEMYWSDTLLDADSTAWNKTTDGPVFNHKNWEPGYTEVRYVKVANEGNLSFKYNLFINPTGKVGELAEVIDVSYDVVTDNANFKAPTATDKQGSLTKAGTLMNLIDSVDAVAGGVLLPEGTTEAGYYSGDIIVCISFHMQETAGNTYQGKSVGDSFGINLYATQYDYENDSFDNSYDENAKWPIRDYSASTAISTSDLLLGALTNDVTIGGANGVGATIPADVKVEDGATSLDLTMKKVENNGNITLDVDESATSFDVHIAGVASDNTQPMIVNLGAILPMNLSDTELKFYHTENGTPVQMTKVASASDFALHNQFTYDPATGEVSIYVATFSVFSAVKTGASVWDGSSADVDWYKDSETIFTLENAADFAGFRKLVDEGKTFAGKTVKLAVDIDLAGKPFDPIGFGYWKENKVVDGVDTNTVFMGTFDGQGHTIYNLYQNCWELDPDKEKYSTYTYSTAGAGLFASIKNATIQNLAVSGAEIVFECVDMGIVVGYAQGECHFENIIVTNSQIANYNRYTGGVVGEVSYGPYGIDTSKGYSHTFKNVTVDSSVTVSGLWGSFGCGMGGVIGGKWGDATVKMENVISAPVMDVYNDVVSAYQWYAFRGCGMLIGHTEEPYSDGRHSGNATASFLTCENVKVYYGDWVNYTYYQFANQSDSEGNRLWYSDYPWVRVEEGKYCDALSNIRYGIPVVNGVKVTELSEEAFKNALTDTVNIVFNQLYGADRGMYGTNEHPGVTVIHKNTKTIYFMNVDKWSDLKLHYYYKNGEDTWTNIPDGISLGEAISEQGISIYKVTVPVYANEFYITGANDEQKTISVSVSDITDGYLYYINDTEIKHCEYKEGYKTVYFENNKNWKDVYIYYWCNDGKSDWGTIDFPGEKMNLVSSEGVYDVYSFVIPAYATGFVFSDGKENVTGTEHYQSVDVKLTSDPDGKIFYLGNIDYNQVVDGNKVNYKYSVYSTQYKSGYTTIYFQNNWLWEDVQIYYSIDGITLWSQGEIKLLGYNSNNEYYSAVLPNYAAKFNISGERDVSSDRQQTVNLTLSQYTTKNLVKLNGGSGSSVSVTQSTFSTSTELTGYKTIYLKPGDWNKDGAWFQAWIWGGDQGETWITFRDKDGDGVYEANIPVDRTGMNILRKGSGHGKKSWTFWNRTGDVTITLDKNLCTIINHWNAWVNNSGGASGSWSTKQ